MFPYDEMANFTISINMPFSKKKKRLAINEKLRQFFTRHRGMRIIYLCRLTNVFCSKFSEDYLKKPGGYDGGNIVIRKTTIRKLIRMSTL